jgi:predicted amidohydrolase YtcJ
LLFFLADADLVLTNGRIWTGRIDQPWAEAVSIQGNTIREVGSSQAIAKTIGKSTKVIDLGGRLTLPGFNDAHVHFLGTALRKYEVDLNGARSLEAMQQRIRDFARAHPDEPWITGGGWEYSYLPGNLPTRQQLDAAVKDRPVWMRSYDGHTAWANSKALELARVTRASHVSGMGEMVRDPATGELTGVLKESAMSLVSKVIPEPSRARKLAALRQAMREAASLGITSIQNATGSRDELSLYEELRKELTLRVAMAISVGSKADLKPAARDPLLHASAIKIFMDGVIETHTAAMLDAYSDLPSSSGTPNYSQEQLNDMVAQCDREGWQILIHAIGDLAIRMTLNAYEEALRRNGPHDARFRIEHIETVAAADIPRFAKLGVLASMMPIHADPETPDVWSNAIGPDRTSRGFAWRTLEQAGARLVFSSDFPASISLDPIHGIHTAVTRQTAEGKPPGGWIPEQRVTLETALHGYTTAAAYASFEEKTKGAIAPGMLADIVVLNSNLFEIDPAQIHATRVWMTVFDGRIVHRQ